MIFIDDFSKKTWAYFLKKKLDALFVFKTFKIKVEKEIGKVIKVLKSDNGGEFINSQFMKYYQDRKIRRKFSQAYTPQQNGVVERKNRTIVERVKNILLENKLPINLWIEVVNTTNYVVNCSLS
jgi:transposase InsO family protein